MRSYSTNLKIANLIIRMESRFPLQLLSKEEKRKELSERFDNFTYRGKKEPDVLLKVEIVDKLPEIQNATPLFITYHFQDKSENWRLLEKDGAYLYKSPLKDKEQLIEVNKTFDRVRAFLLKKKDEFYWKSTDIIYDFLQVLLINYFARRNQGIFTHAIGIKDLDGRGLLFAGRSGTGKSTMARIWHKHSKAMVLNDDRIIVRKSNGKFTIHGSPWHGEFSDYLASRIESAPLEKLFFIHHSANNRIRRLSQKEAFNLLYPALFPTFWNKRSLENIVSFCQDLIKNVSCYNLGFVKNKDMIEFVRRIK